MSRVLSEPWPRECAVCDAAPEADRFAWIVANYRFLIGSTRPGDAVAAMAEGPLSLEWYFRCNACGVTVDAFFGAHAGGLRINRQPFVVLAAWPEFELSEDFDLVNQLTEADSERLESEVASWGGVDRLRARMDAGDRRLWSAPFDDRARPELARRRGFWRRVSV